MRYEYKNCMNDILDLLKPRKDNVGKLINTVERDGKFKLDKRNDSIKTVYLSSLCKVDRKIKLSINNSFKILGYTVKFKK